MPDLSPEPPNSDKRRAHRGDSPSEKAAADRLLMRRFTSGEEAAFSDFYDRFSPGLFSMIFEMLRDQKEAEDVLQDVFVQIWKKAAAYDPARSNVFTWAVMIARHKAIDHLRSRQRRDRMLEAASAESVETTSAATPSSDAIDANDDRRRVQDALLRLSDSQREAIDLAFFSGLTQAEISNRVGAPLGTIKARIRRGLIALRDILGELQ